MSSKVWVFLAVTLASIGAGVAVAGIPSGRSVELSDIPGTAPADTGPADTTATTDSPTPTTTEPATVEPETTESSTTESTTTEPTPTTEPSAGDSAPVDTAAPETTTAPQDAATTLSPTTTVSTSTTAPPTDRVQLSIVVANGAALPGVAGDTADRLAELGYPTIRTLDGSEIFERSAVFAAPGLQAEAERLAVDVGIDPSLVFPISAAPELLDALEEPLLVYLGTDVTSL